MFSVIMVNLFDRLEECVEMERATKNLHAPSACHNEMLLINNERH